MHRSDLNRNCAALVGFSCLFAFGQSLADDVLVELKACANTSDDAARAACYETLGQRVLNSEFDVAQADESSDEKEPLSIAATPVMPDDLGGDAFKKDGKDEREVPVRGTVVSCKKSAADNKWFYFFENGQVWKQVDSRRRSHRDCEFDVTIVKDGFGYKMQIDGSEGKIRISRKR